MKKVRNILILLLAALMLTVFVSCDQAIADSDPDTGTEEENPTVEKKVGDLVITKVYLKTEDEKMFVLENIGNEPIDLTGYAFLSDQGNSKYAKALPECTLASGKGIYFFNHKGSSQLDNTFPNFKMIPAIPYEDSKLTDYHTPIEEDMRWSGPDAKNYGLGTMEIVKNVDDLNAPTSWETVDKVLIKGKNPIVGTQVIRDYDETTRIDNGFKTVTDISLFDAHKPNIDYSFATLQPLLETGMKNKALTTDVNYTKLSVEDRAKFAEDADKAGWIVDYTLDAKDETGQSIYRIHFAEKNNDGLYLTQNNGGSWHHNDYRFSTLKTNYDLDKTKLTELKSYPFYPDMPEKYKTVFENSAVGCKNIKFDKYDFYIDMPENQRLHQYSYYSNNKKYIKWSVETVDPRVDDTLPTHSIIEEKYSSTCDLAITQVYVGQYGGKFLAITNTGNTNVSLNNYYVACSEYKDKNAKDTYIMDTLLPKVELAAGKTIYILNKSTTDTDAQIKKGENNIWSDANGLNNLKNMNKLNSNSTGPVTEDSILEDGKFSAKNHKIAIGYSENARNENYKIETGDLKEIVTCGTPKSKYQDKHYFLRVFDTTKPEEAFWRNFNTKDQETQKMLNDSFPKENPTV